jgi:hypothetical protein
VEFRKSVGLPIEELSFGVQEIDRLAGIGNGLQNSGNLPACRFRNWVHEFRGFAGLPVEELGSSSKFSRVRKDFKKF